MKARILSLLILALPLAAAAQITDSGAIKYDTIGGRPTRTFDANDLRRGRYVRQETRAMEREEPVEEPRARRSAGRWILGGGIGFGWGDSEWNIQISPQLGYRVTDMLVLGGGISYGYFEGRGWYDYHANIFGVNGLVEFFPIRYISLFAQPEVCYQWGRSGGYKVDTDPVFCLPMGVGFVIPVGRGGITVSFSYDVVQNRHSPYGDRIGSSIGYTFRW